MSALDSSRTIGWMVAWATMALPVGAVPPAAHTAAVAPPATTSTTAGESSAATLRRSQAANRAPKGPAPTLPHQSTDRSLGIISCASSTCHGSTTAWQDSTVLRNEYTTWLRLDPHSAAYSTLLREDSRRIAQRLGLPQPAHQSPLCLDCHAHHPAPQRRDERFVVAEGVSCEACHGPAQRWIATHVEPQARHERNIAHGLYPSSRPVDQVKLCLSCHFGDESRFVTHRLMGAGHPRLSFEVGLFSALATAHYRVDDDYVRRKGRPDPVQLWAIGQALSAQTLLRTLADPQRSRDGLFPELVLFDCHACHRSLHQQRWTPRLGQSPGTVRLNDSSLLMVRALLRTVDPADSLGFRPAVAQLHAAVSAPATAGDGRSLEQRVRDQAQVVVGLLDKVIARLEQNTLDPQAQRRLLLSLIEEGRGGAQADYAGAEQTYMALVSVANGLAAGGGFQVDATTRQAIERLRKRLADEDRHDPQGFAQDLLKLQETIAQTTGARP